MIDNAAALALWLSAGAYAPVVASQPLDPLFQTPAGGPVNGLRLGITSAKWEDGDLTNVTSSGELDARLFVDGEGTLQVDQFRLESGFASVRVRPLLGDGFDLALLGGSFETTWSYLTVDDVQIQLYSPSLITLLGFSNTDADADQKLKHYLAVGIGPGVRVTGQVVGSFGVFANAEAMARSFNRHQKDAKNQVRHEISAEASLGIGHFAPRSSVLLGGWGEVVTQWEPRDQDGHAGVDRQYAAFGVQMTLLTVREKVETQDDQRERLEADGYLPPT